MINRYKTIIKCDHCLSRNIYYDEESFNETYNTLHYKLFNMPFKKCKFCAKIIKIHKKNIVMNEKIKEGETKMKIDEVKEEEIQTGISLPEKIVFTAEEVEKSDFILKTLQDNAGNDYKRWVMTMEDKTEYGIPNGVMQGFKELREKKRSEIEITKTGSGLSTKYGITFTK